MLLSPGAMRNQNSSQPAPSVPPTRNDESAEAAVSGHRGEEKSHFRQGPDQQELRLFSSSLLVVLTEPFQPAPTPFHRPGARSQQASNRLALQKRRTKREAQLLRDM